MDINNKSNSHAAFFDLDLTITNEDCFRLFLKTFYLKNIINFIYIPYVIAFGILRKLRIISLKEFKERSLIGLKNKQISDIKKIGDNFFTSHIKNTIRKEAIQKIKEHKRNRELVFIVSASPDIYVHAVCRFLNCDGYISSNLNFEGSRFTGHFEGPDCIGVEKKRRVRRLADKFHINLKRSWAYSDHDADLAFLESVGLKVAISPNPRLLRIASNNKWSIEFW